MSLLPKFRPEEYLMALINALHLIRLVPFRIIRIKKELQDPSYEIQNPTSRFQKYLTLFIYTLVWYERLMRTIQFFQNWKNSSTAFDYAWAIDALVIPLLFLFDFYIFWTCKQSFKKILQILDDMNCKGIFLCEKTKHVEQSSKSSLSTRIKVWAKMNLPFIIAVTYAIVNFFSNVFGTSDADPTANFQNWHEQALQYYWIPTTNNDLFKILLIPIKLIVYILHGIAYIEYELIAYGIQAIPIAIGLMLNDVMDKFTNFYTKSLDPCSTNELNTIHQVMLTYEKVKELVNFTNECFGWLYVIVIGMSKLFYPIFLGSAIHIVDLPNNFFISICFCLTMTFWTVVLWVTIYIAGSVDLKIFEFYNWLASEANKSCRSTIPCSVLSAIRIDMSNHQVAMRGRSLFVFTTKLATTTFIHATMHVFMTKMCSLLSTISDCRTCIHLYNSCFTIRSCQVIFTDKKKPKVPSCPYGYKMGVMCKEAFLDCFNY